MKKLLCAALVASLCALGGAAGEAAVPGPVAPRRTIAPQRSAAMVEAAAPYDGVWQPFEDGFGLYLPRGWASVELTEAQREAGLFYRAGSGDGAMGIAVGYMEAGGLGTLDALAEDFRAAGYSAVVRRDLHGIPAIRFERPQDDYRGVAFFHPACPDYVLYVYVSPLGQQDAEARRLGEGVLASIVPSVKK